MSNSSSASSAPDNSPEQDANAKSIRQSRATKPRKPRARFNPEYERLLEKLIAARKAAGVKQEVVAKALGKTQSHVSMCESREREISIIDLWKWCLVIGIPLSGFIRELEQGGVPALQEVEER